MTIVPDERGGDPHCPVCLRPIGSERVNMFSLRAPDGSGYLVTIHVACDDKVTRCHVCGKSFTKGEMRVLRRRQGQMLAWHVDHEPSDVDEAAEHL